MNPKKSWNIPPEDVIREALERPKIWEGTEEKWVTWKERKPSDEIDKTGQRIVDIIKDL